MYPLSFLRSPYPVVCKYRSICDCHLNSIQIRAGMSPTFWDPGTPSNGLAGIRGFASPIEELLIRRTLASPLWVLWSGLIPAIMPWPCRYPGSRVPLNSSNSDEYGEILRKLWDNWMGLKIAEKTGQTWLCIYGGVLPMYWTGDNDITAGLYSAVFSRRQWLLAAGVWRRHVRHEAQRSSWFIGQKTKSSCNQQLLPLG